MEPELACESALISPQSGVFDSHGYMLALQGEIEAAGGAMLKMVRRAARGAIGAGGGWATGRRLAMGGGPLQVCVSAY